MDRYQQHSDPEKEEPKEGFVTKTKKRRGDKEILDEKRETQLQKDVTNFFRIYNTSFVRKFHNN